MLGIKWLDFKKAPVQGKSNHFLLSPKLNYTLYAVCLPWASITLISCLGSDLTKFLKQI